MSSTASPSEIIETLAAIEQIKTLKYRYFRCVDQQLFDEVAGCFTHDASVDFGLGGVYDNIADLVAMITTYAKDATAKGMHQGYNPEIDVKGDVATGCWGCTYYSVDAANGVSHKQTGVYEDEYQKVDGQWRIKFSRNTSLFSETASLKDDHVSLALG